MPDYINEPDGIEDMMPWSEFMMEQCHKADQKEKEMSQGEFDSVVSAVSKTEGSRSAAIEAMTDKSSKDYASIAYLDDSEIEEKLFENQAKLLKQPVCRNGKTEATVGMAQKIWEGWK